MTTKIINIFTNIVVFQNLFVRVNKVVKSVAVNEREKFHRQVQSCADITDRGNLGS